MKRTITMVAVAAALAGCAGMSRSNERQEVLAAYHQCQQYVRDDPATALYFAKVGDDFAHQSDTSRATEAEKRAIQAAADGMNRCDGLMVEYMQADGNWAGAALAQKGLTRFTNLTLRLYRGETTWGEYNTARQQVRAASADDIQSARERIRASTPVYVPVPSAPPAPPPQSRNCTTRFIGNTAYTDCR